MDMNFVLQTGRLTNDPKPIQLNTDKSMCVFSMAVNYGHGENKKVYFFDYVAYKGIADIITKYCRKGDQILIQGSQRQKSWENDGVKKYKIETVVTYVQFLSKSKNNQLAESKIHDDGLEAIEVMTDFGDNPFV